MNAHCLTTSFRPDRRYGGWTLIAYSCLLGCAAIGCTGSSNEYVPPPPPTVTYANPIEAPITPFVDENGTTEAAKESEVRARVRGFLKAIEFQPGQFVKQGDVLYKIERDQYEAAVESSTAAVETAIAAIGVAEASVKNAQAAEFKTDQDLEREERLKTQNASSEAQYDAAKAASAAAKAALEAAHANVKAARSQKLQAEAALRQATIDLDFTVVRAEIDGKITKSNFKIGNLVEDGSHLATIIDDREIFANFSISDRAALRIMKARSAGQETSAEAGRKSWEGTPVYLAREGDKGYPFEGTLDNVDQAGIDVETGTLGLRGIFANPENQLLPGMFVSLRVPAARVVDSLLIPERAVLRDQQGSFVLTIGEDNQVGRARINMGQAVSGWAMVLDGLSPTTRVVVDGLQFARPGATVVPDEVTFAVDATMLMRGMSDPEDSRTAPMPEDAVPANGESSAPSTPPTKQQ